MREKPIEEIERGRIILGRFGSNCTLGNNGAFILTTPKGVKLFAIASDGLGWDHVSVSPFDEKRTPTWEEMNWIKDLFWGEEESVIQYHPPKSKYINNYPYVLHLWKPQDQDIPLPPVALVGIQGFTSE